MWSDDISNLQWMWKDNALFENSQVIGRGGICHCRHCQRQCKICASGVNFSIFTHFLCFFLLKLLKLGENVGVKFLAGKSVGVKFLTNSMSVNPPFSHYDYVLWKIYLEQKVWFVWHSLTTGEVKSAQSKRRNQFWKLFRHSKCEPHYLLGCWFIWCL